MITKLRAPNSWKSTDSHMIQHFFPEKMSKCIMKKIIECVCQRVNSIDRLNLIISQKCNKKVKIFYWLR